MFVSEIAGQMQRDLSGSVKKRIICEDLERAVVDAFHMQIDGQTLLKWFNEAIEKFNLK